MSRPNRIHLLRLIAILSLAWGATVTRAAEGITWRAAQKSVDADVRDWELPRLLETLASVTGWDVYLEPDTQHTVTATFKQNAPDDALKKLLGNVNFSLTTPTNSVPRLYVYRTAPAGATQLISGAPNTAVKPGSAKPIPNELIVTLKPGSRTKIEDLARLLGAKVTGRIEGLNAFRLQFDDAAAAQNGRTSLAQNSDVASVDSNFAIERPPPAEMQLAGDVPVPKLKLTPPPSDGHITIGVVDTAMQPLAGDLKSFVLPSLSVAGDPGQLPDTPTHGTAMAETILRALSIGGNGASSALILPVDVYGANAMTTTFDVAQGISQAVNAGANPINLSLGSSGDSPFLHSLIQQAVQKGIVFVAAAGNEPVTTPTYPAAYPEVTAVTAGDQRGNIASYANRGDFVDIIAPGNSVVHENGLTYVVTGTSVSTAYVTGATVARAERAGQSVAMAISQVIQSSRQPAKP